MQNHMYGEKLKNRDKVFIIVILILVIISLSLKITNKERKNISAESSDQVGQEVKSEKLSLTGGDHFEKK